MTSASPFLGGGERDGGEGLPQRRGNAFAEGLKARDWIAWGEAPGPRFPENTERCKRETMPHPRPPPWAGPTALDHSSWSQPGAALPAFAPPQAVISRAFSPPVPAICNRRPWTTAVPPVFMTETRWTAVANRRHGVARHSDVATGQRHARRHDFGKSRYRVGQRFQPDI